MSHDQWFILILVALTVLLMVLVAGLIISLRQRNKAVSALMESEEKYRALVENALEGIVILGMDGAIIFANQAVARMLKIPDISLLQGQNVFSFLAPESAQKAMQDFEQVQNGIDSYISEYRGFTPGGCEIWIESIGKRIVYEGKPADIVSLREITGRKRAEEEKEHLWAQLTQSQKMESVGRLAGGVAHDFNNMLGVIMGHAEMALMESDPDLPIHNSLLEIRKAAERSADLTRQLLTYARKQTIAPEVLILNDEVTDMLDMLQRLIGEEIELIWCPGEQLWPVKLDPGQLDQVLTNLCINARDAISEQGCITVETKNKSIYELSSTDHGTDQRGILPGDYVLLSVRDNGCGMKPDILKNVFEPFYTTKGVGLGTGLGLATVYGIVRQNEGYIMVDSEPDQGSVFRIYLPRTDGFPGVRANQCTQTSGSASGERVLIVEDEPAILNMARIMLTSLGYRVMATSSPIEAIHQAQLCHGDIQLLISDVIMPEMNGQELAEMLLSQNPDIKRLFISGYTADVIAHHCVLDEGVFFLQKPFSMKQLSSKIREALGK